MVLILVCTMGVRVQMHERERRRHRGHAAAMTQPTCAQLDRCILSMPPKALRYLDAPNVPLCVLKTNRSDWLD
eukprot:SAG31_NODE_20366_length_576_cov_1.572327_1_plen_72_part_01